MHVHSADLPRSGRKTRGTATLRSWRRQRLGEVSVRYRWAVLALVLLLVAVAFVGVRVGRDSQVATEEATRLAPQAQIGGTLNDGWDVSVPLDVSWTDFNGAFHESGRPDCLPPRGRGSTGPARVLNVRSCRCQDVVLTVA